MKKSSAHVGFYFNVREYGGDFRIIPRRGLSSENSIDHHYREAPRIIMPGSDIMITAISTNVDTDVTAGFELLFADIKDSPYSETTIDGRVVY